MATLAELEKELRILRRKLERSEQDRAELEDTKEKNESMLRKVIGELEASRAAIENKSAELEAAVDELEEAQSELIQSAKMAALGELVAGVTHEINTPIGVSVTAASHLNDVVSDVRAALEQGNLSKNRFERFLKECEDSTQIVLNNLYRGADLIRSFKLVAVDQSHNSSREYDVGEYLNEIRHSVSGPLRQAGLTMEIDGPADFKIEGDPGLLAQVVTNLVMNAILHAYDPGDGGKISIRYASNRGNLSLEFADDGKGIAAIDLPKIYNPFFTTKRGKGGSGLGLHIIYSIVTREMGGTIQCDSAVGEGTRFLIEVPVSNQKAQASTQRAG